MSEIPQVVGGCVLEKLYQAAKAVIESSPMVSRKRFDQLNDALEIAERVLYPITAPVSTRELTAELRAADTIIHIALNTMHGEQKSRFIQDVCKAGLDGEGVTRANERAALLARVKDETK